MNFEVLPESSLIKKYVCRPLDSASMALISQFELRMGETSHETIVFR